MTDDATFVRALKLVENGDDRLALDQLMSAWPRRKDAALALAIEDLAARTDAVEPGLPTRLRGILERKADDAARELEDIYATVPEHPVVARWLAELLERARHNPDRGLHLTSTAFWSVVFRLVIKHTHPGIFEELQRGLHLHFTAVEREDVRILLRAATQRVYAMRGRNTVQSFTLNKLRKHLQARSRRERAAGKTGAELLAAIYADPDDDGPRIVYADWLSERGDPRGELIVLQLERRRKGAARATPAERRLLEANAMRWLGPLAPVIRKTGLSFERGFLSACRVFTPSAEVAASLRDAIEWSTVEELALDNDLGVLGKYTLAVRRLTGVYHSAAVFTLADRWPRLQELGVSLAPARAVIETMPALPALRELDALGTYVQFSGPGQVRWLWTTPTGQQLDAFAIGSAPATLASWLAEDALHRLPVTRLTITSIRWSDTGPGWQLTLSRDERGELSRLVAVRGAYRLHAPQPTPLDELCDALAAVPSGTLRRLEILASKSLAATPAGQARVERTCAQLGVTDLVKPW